MGANDWNESIYWASSRKHIDIVNLLKEKKRNLDATED